MPAINVARTDTFEQQRLKINEMGTQLFNISAGGSDLSTGNLKLGDGTVQEPSLAFVNNNTLGIYKSSLTGFGFVSENKNIIDFSETDIISFKDINIRQKILTTGGTQVQNDGSGYDAGTFADVDLLGGSGLAGVGNITVVGFEGTITNQGDGYVVGSYEGIVLEGGNGSGATVTFDIAGIQGVVTDGGSSYTDDTYTDTAATNVSSSGSGATFSTIDVVGGEVVNAQIGESGSGYNQGDVISATIPGGSGFEFTITSQPTKVTEVQFTDYGTGYQTGDTLVFPSNTSTFSNINVGGEVAGVTTTLSTASANITVADTTGILAGAEVQVEEGPGDLAANTTVQTVVNGTTLTLSANPTVDGAATLAFTTGVPSELTGFSSVAGIEAGQTVFVISGTGVVGSGVTVDSVDAEENRVVLDNDAEVAGISNIQFGPAMGDPAGTSQDFEFTVGELGVVSGIEIANGGNGYVAGDVLTVSAQDLVVPTTLAVTAEFQQDVEFAQTITAGTISVGDNMVTPAGSVLAPVTIQSSSDLAGEADEVYDVTVAGTAGTGAVFRITRTDTGEVDSVEVLQGGSGYEANELLTVDGSDVGGVDGTDDIGISVDNITELGEDIPVSRVVEAGGNITSVTLKTGDLLPGAALVVSGTTSPVYGATTVGDAYTRFFIDDVLHPSLTLYSGDTYVFDLTGAAGEGFALSQFPDGSNAPSNITGRTSTLTALSTTFTVDDATGILNGMLVTVTGGTGGVAPNTLVTDVTGTTITINQPVTVSGLVILDFTGYEYVDGVTRSATTLSIRINDTTPDLYYYSTVAGSVDYGGPDGSEGLLTTDNNNPRVFGSGATFLVNTVSTSDVITSDVETGGFTATGISSTTLNASNATVGTLTVTSINGGNLSVDAITATNDLAINTGGSTNIETGNFAVGEYLQITGADGNITTTGIIKTTNKFSSNDKLEISENKISTVPGQELLIEPGGQSELVKVISTSSFVIPSGDNNQRPLVAENGAIRFNTITNQYEGYSENSSSWSSLGGVRDLDGNTTILAEETVGANDNTLWFFNDNVNTVKFTPEYQDFVNVKKIRSANVSAPAYEEFRANAPVALGEYLKYRNNIYEVTAAGTTGTSGNEPTHTTGAETNGTAELTFWGSAVSSLTFEEIDELRIDPLGFTDLVVNNELRFSQSEISTNTSDLTLRPNTGQKIVIDAPTSLVIPVGDNNSKGNPATGSIRYNTDDTTFEGYDGTQWGSLGGVKDIDGDTLIRPESAPGADEDILFFLNANVNTLQVNSTQLEFYGIDTIASMQSNELNINAATVTFNNLDTTLDNTDTSSSFLFSTKENFDIGLSSGLNTDPLLRFTDTGDIFYNLGFGTGTYSGVKLFDTDLKVLELADYKVVTNDVSLEKGGIATGASDLYNSATETAAKVTLVANNTTTGDKELIEFSVINKGSDVFFTEIGNVVSGATLIGSTTFDINPSNEVRITFVLDDDLTNGDAVDVTTVTHVIK